MLKGAGFESIEHYDTTDITREDVLDYMFNQFFNKKELKEAFGSAMYYTVSEALKELASSFTYRIVSHCCFIAQKS